MRHPLSLAAQPNPTVVDKLTAMDPTPCGVPHHHKWLHNGNDQRQCPHAVKETQVRCLHSKNETLREALREAQRRRLITAVQAMQLDIFLQEHGGGAPWQADMHAVTLGNYAHYNQAGIAYSIPHNQGLVGLPRDQYPVEHITPEVALQLMRQFQMHATQARENIRQLLLGLFSRGARTAEDEAATDALIAEVQLPLFWP